jgi:hypothetical protein
MAIHPDHPGLEVHVAVNDQPLREYEDEDAIADTKTITRYIEVRAVMSSKSGTGFPNLSPIRGILVWTALWMAHLYANHDIAEANLSGSVSA